MVALKLWTLHMYELHEQPTASLHACCSSVQGPVNNMVLSRQFLSLGGATSRLFRNQTPWCDHMYRCKS
jgi:hypothetical protein